MELNNDYYKLYLERIKSINYLYENINERSITLTNEEYLSLFIIGEDNYNNKIMNNVDISFIESLFELDEIEIIHTNIKKILDLTTNYRVSDELNKKIVFKCLDYYNKNNNNALNIININKVLDNISKKNKTLWFKKIQIKSNKRVNILNE